MNILINVRYTCYISQREIWLDRNISFFYCIIFYPLLRHNFSFTTERELIHRRVISFYNWYKWTAHLLSATFMLLFYRFVSEWMYGCQTQPFAWIRIYVSQSCKMVTIPMLIFQLFGQILGREHDLCWKIRSVLAHGKDRSQGWSPRSR